MNILATSSLSPEERTEATRHDALYHHTRGEPLRPDDWERFDHIPHPTNGYLDSVQQLGDVRGKRVLDYGCGTGWLSIILAKRGASVVGIDISAAAINTARSVAYLHGVEAQTTFQVASAYDLPYAQASFDCIIGQAILHHLRDKARAAAELYRVLRPGGRAVFFEAFGASRWLERLRLLVPVSMDEENRTHWQEQMTYADLQPFRRWFQVRYREWQLLSRLDRLVAWRWVVAGLGRLDVWLLAHVPFVRRYARTIVVTLEQSLASDRRETVAEHRASEKA